MQRLLLGMGAVASLGASVAGAQQQLVDRKTASSGIVFESWNFGNVKPGSGSAMVSSATQFTIPFTSVIPLREGWARLFPPRPASDRLNEIVLASTTFASVISAAGCAPCVIVPVSLPAAIFSSSVIGCGPTPP